MADTAINLQNESEKVQAPEAADKDASVISLIREQLKDLSHKEQINLFAQRVENAQNKEESKALTQEAANAGFLEEYKTGKWRPVKNKQGKGAIKIINALKAFKPKRTTQSNPDLRVVPESEVDPTEEARSIENKNTIIYMDRLRREAEANNDKKLAHKIMEEAIEAGVDIKKEGGKYLPPEHALVKVFIDVIKRINKNRRAARKEKSPEITEVSPEEVALINQLWEKEGEFNTNACYEIMKEAAKKGMVKLVTEIEPDGKERIRYTPEESTLVQAFKLITRKLNQKRRSIRDLKKIKNTDKFLSVVVKLLNSAKNEEGLDSMMDQFLDTRLMFVIQKNGQKPRFYPHKNLDSVVQKNVELLRTEWWKRKNEYRKEAPKKQARPKRTHEKNNERNDKNVRVSMRDKLKKALKKPEESAA